MVNEKNPRLLKVIENGRNGIDKDTLTVDLLEFCGIINEKMKILCYFVKFSFFFVFNFFYRDIL